MKDTAPTKYETDFHAIVNQIQQTKRNVYQFANQSLIDLYWNIGQIISQQVASSKWGKSIVSELAKFIVQQDSEIKGFSDKNLWQMKQFYETYQDNPKLSPLVREIAWMLLPDKKLLQAKLYEINTMLEVEE